MRYRKHDFTTKLVAGKSRRERKNCDAGDSNKVISDWWGPYYVILNTGCPRTWLALKGSGIHNEFTFLISFCFLPRKISFYYDYRMSKDVVM